MDEPKKEEDHKPEHSIHHVAKTKKKPNWYRIGGLILVVAIIVAIILTVVIPNGKIPEYKEVWNITYEQYVDGQVLATGTGVYDANSLKNSFELIGFKLDQVVDSMEPGQEQEITLESLVAYGEYDPTLVYDYPRVEKDPRSTEIPRDQQISIDDFSGTFGEQPIQGNVYPLEGAPWDYKVKLISGSTITISIETTVGKEIPLGLFTSKVNAITADKVTLKLYGDDQTVPTDNGNVEVTFTETEVVYTLTPEIGQVVQLGDFPEAIVISYTAENIVLDANHPLAGKSVVFKIIVNRKEMVPTGGSSQGTIPGAPTLQYFVMSYCPYGLQEIKAMLPVMKAFAGKANVELRFVNYILHGEKEDLENQRMVCIREEQNAKLIPYLECFVEAGDTDGCLTKAKVDVAKVNSCMSSRYAGYFEVDDALNEQYGVRGSPTVVLNGVEAQLQRNPQAIVDALCAAFTGAVPTECTQQFSTTNAAPSFGTGSSGESTASC
ncbi:MAG: hypothetical protein ABH817_01335 [archaeon]